MPRYGRSKVIRSLILLSVLAVPWQALADDGKPKLLLMDLKATLIEPEAVGIITNMVSAEMAGYEAHFEIITNADMRQMVALEAEKQSMGCADDSSCLAELAGAMGARFVMFGEVGKLGKNIIITLNLFDSQEAKAAGRVILRANSLDEIPDKVPPALDQIGAPVCAPRGHRGQPTDERGTGCTRAQGGQSGSSTGAQGHPKNERTGRETRLSVGSGLGLGGGSGGGRRHGPALRLARLQTAVSPKSVSSGARRQFCPPAWHFTTKPKIDQNDFLSGPVYGLVGGGVAGWLRPLHRFVFDGRCVVPRENKPCAFCFR